MLQILGRRWKYFGAILSDEHTHSSTVDVTIEEFCQNTQKKHYPWLRDHASDCWRIMLLTAEQSCKRQLNNRVNRCWKMMPVTVKELYQWLLNNCTSDCWTIVPTAVEQSCKLFFSVFFTIDPMYRGHLRFLENLSAIARCPLHRGSVFFREKTLINVNQTTG